jgi:hypothetical protein
MQERELADLDGSHGGFHGDKPAKPRRMSQIRAKRKAGEA